MTHGDSMLPDMTRMARALKELATRQAHLKESIGREDDGHTRALEVHEILSVCAHTSCSAFAFYLHFIYICFLHGRRQ